MNPTRPLELPAHTLAALAAYLQEIGSNAELEHVVAVAVEDWIAHERKRAARNAAPGAPDAGRGYQWKTLFLPSGTRVRMHYQDKFHYAQVEGDDLVFEGRSTSPAQMTNAISGNTRNAWRDLWLLFPGETTWKMASLRRRQAQQLEERLATQPDGLASPAQPAPPAPAPAIEPSTNKELRHLANLFEQALWARREPMFRRRTDSFGDIPFD